jgi:hypothetical protein
MTLVQIEVVLGIMTSPSTPAILAEASFFASPDWPKLQSIVQPIGGLRRHLLLALQWFLIAMALLTVLHSSSYAQQANIATEEPLEEKVDDPTATLTQIQIKDIYTPAEYGTNAQPNTVQIRPIFAIRPFWFIPFEQLIRPTFKVVTVPNGRGASTSTGYDDMQLFDLLVIPWPNSKETHFRWAIGPYFIFPTSSTPHSGKGAWQMGPAAGFSYRGIAGLNIAGLLQQATSFAYTSSRRTPVTSLTFQPILTYQLGGGWALKSNDATWTFNLRQHTSTTIPISAGLGKVWKLSQGYAIDTSVSGEWMLYREFASDEQFTLNFSVSLLFPKLQL